MHVHNKLVSSMRPVTLMVRLDDPRKHAATRIVDDLENLVSFGADQDGADQEFAPSSIFREAES